MIYKLADISEKAIQAPKYNKIFYILGLFKEKLRVLYSLLKNTESVEKIPFVVVSENEKFSAEIIFLFLVIAII